MSTPLLALALIATAQFVLVLDITIVTVALPTIQRELGFPQAELQWLVTSYALAFGGFLLLAGRAADLFGRRRPFVLEWRPQPDGAGTSLGPHWGHS